jgi:ABC-type bacteriocin/lantibiotic exporter with double-glycine peptidase domain
MATATQAAGGLAARDHALPDGLLRYVWQEGRWQQVRLCLLAGAVFPLTMVPLELQRRIVDDAIGGEDLRLLALLGGVYLAAVLLQGALKFLLRFYRGVVSERAIRGLRQRLQAAPAGQGAGGGEGLGETVSIVTAEVERVGGFLGEALSEPVLQLGIFASILGYMLVVEPMIALTSLLFFVPQLVFVPLLQRLVNRRAKRKVKLLREVGELIVAPPADDHDADYHERLQLIYRVRLQYYALKFLIKFLNNLLNHLAPLAVLMVGGYMVIQGTTTVGVVVAFISGFMRLADPSRELLAYYRLAAETRVQYRLITRWLPSAA